MKTEKALDMLECMANLDESRLLSYLCKHVGQIGAVAKIGADAIRQVQSLDKLMSSYRKEEENVGS